MFTLPKKESFYSKYIHLKTGLFSSVSQRRWWVDYLCIDECRFRHQSRITLLVSVLSLVSCWSLPFQTHPHLGKKKPVAAVLIWNSSFISFSLWFVMFTRAMLSLDPQSYIFFPWLSFLVLLRTTHIALSLRHLSPGRRKDTMRHFVKCFTGTFPPQGWCR